jgi:transcriptional regulator
MYQPPHFREERRNVQHQLIEAHPLGLLISVSTEGPVANAIPFLLRRDKGRFGTLQAHMARANAQWKQMDGQPVLAVFQGAHSYISPSHYETKRETGKVVPTWNYVIVQARGIAQVMQETGWLAEQIGDLTQVHEQAQQQPWAVSDAPDAYIESQMRGIVGVEIEIQALNGKWKVSQNRPQADRQGVEHGLAMSNPAMAKLVRDFGVT